MKRPEKFTTGNHKPHHIQPCLLAKDMWRYHMPVLGMKPAEGEQVVMWTDGAVQFDGYEAGTHDGSLSARTDMHMNFVRYALLSDWIAAGNAVPA